MFDNKNILKLFFIDPVGEYSVREVARKLNISPSTASTHLKELEKRKLITSRRFKNLLLYKANLDNSNFRILKISYTLYSLVESGFINEVNRSYLMPTIILYGSAAKGMDTLTSDIDLCIITHFKERKIKNISIYEEALKRSLHIVVVESINELGHLKKEIIEEGIIIQGDINESQRMF